MKKKQLRATLANLMAFASVIALAGCEEKETAANVKIYDLHASERYMQDENVEGKKQESKTLTFAGMKNETQSAQLMFNSDKEIYSFDLNAADLTKEGSTEKIAASNVSIYAERYIEVYRPAPGGSWYEAYAGFYPDAIVPLDAYQKRLEDRVDANMNQALWVDVEVPATATAGTYKGTFELLINGESTNIDVSLKVYDVTLPDEVHNPSMINIWYESIPRGEQENYDGLETDVAYYNFLHEKRVNCENIPNGDMATISASWLEWAAELAEKPECTIYKIPHGNILADREFVAPIEPDKYTEAQIEENKIVVKNQIKEKLKTILDYNLKLREENPEKASVDMFEKAIFYFEDEPAAGSYRAQSVRVFCEMLHKAKQELVAEYAEKLADHKDIEASLLDVREICPADCVEERGPRDDVYNYAGGLMVSNKEDGTPDYDLSDGLTHWCPSMYRWNDADFREMTEERIANGEIFWWYTCIRNSPDPSYLVECIPLNIRLQQWMQYDYSITGVLYWQVCEWPYGGVDPYEDICNGAYSAGEGILVYPGVRYGLKTPVSSWRLENIRLGQQDYEIFWMLDEALDAAESTISAQQLVSNLGKNMYRGTALYEETNTVSFEGFRLQLLDILELFQKGETAQAISKAQAIVNN